MKKIVGIIAAAAMATSVFAVDLNSMIQFDGDLMNYSKDGGFKAFELNDYDPQGTSDYVWKLSASGDKAGGEIWYYSSADGNPASGATVNQYTIWFKPIDQLKVSVGNLDYGSVLKPQFGWWAMNSELAGYGYSIEFRKDSLNVNFALEPGKAKYWFSSKNEGYDKIANFWFDANYAFDVGTLQAYVSKGAAVNPHGFPGWLGETALTVGAVWGNCGYLQTGYFADVAAVFKYKDWKNTSWETNDGLSFNRINAQIYGQYFANGFGVQLINVVSFYPSRVTNKADWSGLYEADAEVKYGFELKAQYALDGFTPYIQIDGYKVMDKEISIDLCVSTNVGGASMWAGIRLPISFEDYEFNFSVPCEITLNL